MFWDRLIHEPLLCRIVSEAPLQPVNSYCFPFTYQQQNTPGSGIVLSRTGDSSHFKSIPLFQLNEDDISLEPGDIVLLEPSGVGTVLYQSKTHTNSVLLTEKCNCRCIMCPQPPQNDTEDFVDLSLRTIRLMDANTKTLCITGGEPTIVWEGLKKVLSACHAYIPSASIQILTNARTFKDYSKAEELAREGGRNIFLGIPLYSDVDMLHDKLVSSEGAFWDTVEGIYNLERAGIFIELRTVITRLNFMRLPQWAEYIYRTFPFAGHVAFMGMEPIGLALQNIEQLWIDPIDYMAQLEKAVKILYRRNMSVSIYNHQLCTLHQNLWPLARESISEWKTVYTPECNSCQEKPSCGGFFHSARVYKSRGIKPL